MIIEYRVPHKFIYKLKEFWHRKSSWDHQREGFIDADVFAEKMRVNGMWMNEIVTHNLVLKEVTKYYNKFRAVNELSIVVDK